MTTLSEWLSPQLQAGSTAAAQRFQTPDGWRGRSYGELHDLVRRTAHVLHGLGAGPDGPVAIVARTSPEWSVVDLAAALIGAPIVPVYPTSSAVQIADIVRRTRPAVVVTDRDDVVWPDAVTKRLGTAPGSLGELESGPLDDVAVAELDVLASRVTGDDVYSIVFSSGSTGAPKGCVLTHANYVAVLRAASAFETAGPDGAAHREHAFVFLPLAHVSARLQQLTTFTLGGELIYGSGDTAQVLAQIEETRPTYVPGVPRLFESAYQRVGRDPQGLRALFGPRLQYALTGGAPIDPAVLAAYAEAGILLVEGYGLTETSAALTLCTPHANRPGSVGLPLPGVELCVASDGELLARGPNIFRGYLDDPEATREAMPDGWFATGDLGRVDEDGFVFITGRKKNLLVTSTGKNIAPEPIENRLRLTLGLDDVVLVGDARPYLSAIVFAPDAEDAALCAGVAAVNLDASPPERVRRLVVVPRPLDAAHGEVTPSGKVVRAAVLERCRSMIDDLYAGRPVASGRVLEVEVPQALARTP